MFFNSAESLTSSVFPLSFHSAIFQYEKTFSIILKTIGVIFISMAVVFAWAGINSFMERIGHGSGLMFADAEIFLGLFLIFLASGIFCFWIEKKLSFPKK